MTDAGETREPPAGGGLWCPSCRRRVSVEDPELHVDFSPCGSRLTLGGALDWGDCFMDYDHLPCSTKVRISAHMTWDKDIEEYVTRTDNSWIEVDVAGQLIHIEGSEERVFSANTGDHVVWVETMENLLRLLSGALDRLHLESKGVAE